MKNPKNTQIFLANNQVNRLKEKIFIEKFKIIYFKKPIELILNDFAQCHIDLGKSEAENIKLEDEIRILKS
jgi:hypothetical protein